MFIFTSATAQSQAGGLCCVTLAALGYTLVATGGNALGGALLVGMGMGFGATVRIQVALPVGAVLLPLTAWALVKRRAFGSLAAMSVTFLAWLALVGAYDRALTGSAFKLP